MDAYPGAVVCVMTLEGHPIIMHDTPIFALDEEHVVYGPLIMWVDKQTVEITFGCPVTGIAQIIW